MLRRLVLRHLHAWQRDADVQALDARGLEVAHDKLLLALLQVGGQRVGVDALAVAELTDVADDRVPLREGGSLTARERTDCPVVNVRGVVVRLRLRRRRGGGRDGGARLVLEEVEQVALRRLLLATATTAVDVLVAGAHDAPLLGSSVADLGTGTLLGGHLNHFFL